MHANENHSVRRKSAAHLKAPAHKVAKPLPAVASDPPPSRKSIAGLTVRVTKTKSQPAPQCRPPSPGRETTAVIERMRALRDSLPPNKNDRAVAMIKVCIMEGICIDRRIVSFLVHLGFNNGHAGRTLHQHTLGKGSVAYWSKGADNRYRIIE